MNIETYLKRAQKHALEAAEIAGKTRDSDISSFAYAAANAVDRAMACTEDDALFIVKLCRFALACRNMCRDAAQ